MIDCFTRTVREEGMQVGSLRRSCLLERRRRLRPHPCPFLPPPPLLHRSALASPLARLQRAYSCHDLKSSPPRLFTHPTPNHPVQALFKGLAPNYVKVVPSIAIAFVTYEQARTDARIPCVRNRTHA